VPELKRSKQPFKGMWMPKDMSDEQKQRMNDQFPKDPVFECWYKGCCRQFTSELAVDNHRMWHQQKGD
ncbi:MAG: hypothetical protein EZS28_031375, partial [Streblomastix strix]